MSTQNGTKVNNLLQSHPPGVVLLSSWLSQQGYSLDLQKRYARVRSSLPIAPKMTDYLYRARVSY